MDIELAQALEENAKLKKELEASENYGKEGLQAYLKLEKENDKLQIRNGELAWQVASLNRWLGEAKSIIREVLNYDLCVTDDNYYDFLALKTKAEILVEGVVYANIST